MLRFVVGNWVTVTDDFRELASEPGEMARIISIDEGNAKLVLDRGLPSAGGRAFGGNATELANRHTRVQRWDQSAPTNALDADGLIPTAAGPIAIEEGIRVSFSVDPVGGAFNEGDYWVFWARTATASIEILERSTAARDSSSLRAACCRNRARRHFRDSDRLPPPTATAGRGAMLLHFCLAPG